MLPGRVIGPRLKNGIDTRIGTAPCLTGGLTAELHSGFLCLSESLRGTPKKEVGKSLKNMLQCRGKKGQERD